MISKSNIECPFDISRYWSQIVSQGEDNVDTTREGPSDNKADQCQAFKQQSDSNS